ncbi:methyltransferase family protein [Vibrio ulleungensis]|uniref:Isoprenylcysteine carboxylmethyltransferase family protein n=1 Tax=Vibrio ulleungensis TaxID=2807619 RepID=A0ABS2HHT7_9VIBR|nr:isoprenylcysteine carboxylmethyltransferase family protein [Vibrio ulleungensis]MBM7036574.1 isoprenylcysteine carboxylmethyltransferase family protein [Vibrio ulleungensis]
MRNVFIPPPVVMGLCGLLAAWMVDFKYQLQTSTLLVVCLLVIIGVYIALEAVMAFKRANTTIHPNKAEHTVTLVVEGVYAFTRNPMYLSMLCVLIAWCLVFVSAWGWISVGVYIGYITRFQIMPEEQVLKRKFGKSYESYCLSVRRWV